MLNTFSKKRLTQVALLLVLIVALACFVLPQLIGGPAELQITFMAVGKADCIVCQLPDGRTILIDAGDDDTENIVIDYLERQGIEKIDYIIATHPHKDHIGGMAAVIEAFDIGIIVMPDIPENQLPNSPAYTAMMDAIDKKNCEIVIPDQGEMLIKDDSVSMQIVSRNTRWEDMNNYSLVTRLTFRNVSFLFEGDAQAESEQAILADGLNVRADVLKVGHHGSSTSSSSSFLAAVRPVVGVISVGDNDSGLPKAKTLARLVAAGIRVLRTDIVGNIIITSDGWTWKIKLQNVA